MYFIETKLLNFIQISFEGLTDIKSTLAQVTYGQASNKLLPEPMITQFCDPYVP